MTVGESYIWCEEISRKSGSNFYYAFGLLPPARRRSLCAVYAFNRRADDLIDTPEIDNPAAGIERWSSELEETLACRPPDHSVWPALRDTIDRHKIPAECFRDMVEGVRSDLTPARYKDFEALREYCYRVASSVGLMVIHIFGFQSGEAIELAKECGLAVQLTNILRDVREDAQENRVYIPEEELAMFSVTKADLLANAPSEKFVRLMRFQSARARKHFAAAKTLLDLIEPESRGALWAILEVYSRLLARIERVNYDVLSARVRVPAWEKMWILARARWI